MSMAFQKGKTVWRTMFAYTIRDASQSYTKLANIESASEPLVDEIPKSEAHGAARLPYFLLGFLLAVVFSSIILFIKPIHVSTTGLVRIAATGPHKAQYYYEIGLFSNDNDPEPLLNKGCGSNVAEARAAGCVFDILTTAWTPPECVDLSVTEEWLQKVLEHAKWPYYLDQAATIPQKDLSLLLSGEWKGELWSTMHLHQWHCLYVWRRMHMAYLGGNPVDTVIRGLRHSKHCEEMMMSGEKHSPDDIAGVQSVYFRQC
ncbi:hypothetical protein BKA65DRAFT_479607 [Rhexocercosporidium sp. MPI-PUGE-AT-0058]|nr:hypothetical protein BKA65DRAFT_479607 [Rhexocercosporidium sp. MPI-PUGE-AT-0058]